MGRKLAATWSGVRWLLILLLEIIGFAGVPGGIKTWEGWLGYVARFVSYDSAKVACVLGGVAIFVWPTVSSWVRRTFTHSDFDLGKLKAWQAANLEATAATPTPGPPAAEPAEPKPTYRFIHDRRQHEFHGQSGEKTFRVSIQNASTERRDGVRMSLTSIIATGRDRQVRQNKASKAIDLPILFMLPNTLGPDEPPILEMSLAPSEQRAVDLLAMSGNAVPWFFIYTKPDKVIRRGAYSLPERA